MALRVRLIQNNGASHDVEFSAPVVRIGRDSSSDLQLNSDVVSACHAQLELRSGYAFASDLQSRNGTFINGHRISSRVQLKAGDLIGLGESGPKLEILAIDATLSPDVHPAPLEPVEEPAGKPPSATRMMLIQLQEKGKRRWVMGIAAAILLTVMLSFVVSTLIPRSTTQIYDQLLQSVCMIYADGGLGSGALVDESRRLVLTNEHVVGNAEMVTVFFPKFEDGQLNVDRDHYFRHADVLGIVGRVVRTDIRRDLALIELESSPKNARALTLATSGVIPGDRIHTIGNPSVAGGALWVFTTGTVRQIDTQDFYYDDGQGGRRAKLVKTQHPINPGDSGGAVVNDQGELVAVNVSVARNAQTMSSCIELENVKSFLNRQ